MKRFILVFVTTFILFIPCSAEREKEHNFEVAENLNLFLSIYKYLDLIYVDTLQPSEVIGNGIKAMLKSLDPYTEYYPEDKSEDLKMMLQGKYAGIGALIRFHQKLNNVVIDEPYEGMPAAEVGLRKGDVIISIDDSLMAGKGTDYVSGKLRGEAGTTFILKVLRPFSGDTLTFNITRRNIKLPDIPYSGMLNDSIGYIYLTSFTEGCAKNFRRIFVNLKKEGARSLILDLRGNGGGSLQEAVDIVNLWVPKGVSLVETRGKQKQVNLDYSTRLEPVDTLMPIVVCVDGETASASEITCGSLQDLDRAVVLGARTYGKGLVQVSIDLPSNANLKLTTSKYYIPSGRCIQATNYLHSGGGYTERIADSLTHVFHTQSGREVRDGGGITPDVVIASDTIPNIVAYLDHMDSTEVMFDFIVDYISSHSEIPPAEEFHLDDNDFEEFKNRVIESDFTYDNLSGKRFENLVTLAKFEGYYDDATEEFAALKAKLNHDISHDLDFNRDIIMQFLEKEIISAYYFQAGYVRANIVSDKTIGKALSILSDQEEYHRILHPEP